jgi:hypothetical protein
LGLPIHHRVALGDNLTLRDFHPQRWLRQGLPFHQSNTKTKRQVYASFRIWLLDANNRKHLNIIIFCAQGQKLLHEITGLNYTVKSVLWFIGIQWTTEYRTNQVFGCSIIVWLPNGLIIK